MKYGDLTVYGTVAAPLVGPLRILSRHFHRICNDLSQTGLTGGRSRIACVNTSVLVADFLRDCCLDAKAACVNLRIVAPDMSRKGGYRQLDLGRRSLEVEPVIRGWPGHLVVLCCGCLLDMTLYQTQRWWHHLPPMVALPLRTFDGPQGARRMIEENKRSIAAAFEPLEMGTLAIWSDDDDHPNWRQQAAIVPFDVRVEMTTRLRDVWLKSRTAKTA